MSLSLGQSCPIGEVTNAGARVEQAVCGSLDPLLLTPTKTEAELICPSSSFTGVPTKFNFVHSQDGVSSDSDEQLLGLLSLPMGINAPPCTGKLSGRISTLGWQNNKIKQK